ncbi:amylo-alpha-1,6-glucosidase [Neobacillus sp. YIM B06451]|uniref:amylo-alpha-1,6-glucosidase n=1 Tax=Neobacillus sp. YIM B06451 TaxID=3070994 RepID=UPI002930B625|nr:amylo-alpha-1,6-glucosidase [Neobacillus sp. YIM B06451]
MDYRVIKENDLFLLTDKQGDIPVGHPYGLGLYTKDTRFLSKLNLYINGEKPILLSSDADENYMAKILLTNPHMENHDGLILWRESVEIERSRFISDDVLYETIKVKNYFPKQVSFEITLEMDADFKDMFIIRGFQKGKVGSRTGQEINGNSLTFGYVGSDNITRKTVVSWDKTAKAAEADGRVTFSFTLGHEEEDSVTFFIQPHIGNASYRKPVPVNTALGQLQDSYDRWARETTTVKTDYSPLQTLVQRGIDDLRVLLTDVGFGPFPVAGLPWFGVPFGRDSIIAALQMLAFNPQIAKGTILTMANYQGKKLDPWRDEQPGKIMHEIRYGELASTGQIPFTPYYGTIDATPLFLILVKEYVNWTGDYEILEDIESNIESALKWIDSFGDRDGDLFVEYHQESSKGIANQGWKDSGDSIVHRNGHYAKSPIALSEVQGYVYQAKAGIADLYDHLGKTEKAEKLRADTQKLKDKFNDSFWMEDREFYAIALDAEKKQVGTITSNPGHLLYSGILNEERANAVSNMLLSPKMFSGYGIRTMGEGEAGYNPMSYHDGSIWPHDNSLILLGLSKTGRQDKANQVIGGLIKASGFFEYNRLPELFCGYGDSLGKAVKYPVACSPQAWAAGTPLVFIQTILGLFPDCATREMRISPLLLPEMNELSVYNIRIGEGILSLEAVRTNDGVKATIIENTTGYAIIQN